MLQVIEYGLPAGLMFFALPQLRHADGPPARSSLIAGAVTVPGLADIGRPLSLVLGVAMYGVIWLLIRPTRSRRTGSRIVSNAVRRVDSMQRGHEGGYTIKALTILLIAGLLASLSDVLHATIRMTSIASAAIFLGLILIARDDMRKGFDIRATIYGAIGIYSSTLLIGAFRSDTWTECNQTFGKCSPAGALYSAGFASENTVGLCGAFLICVLMSQHRSGARRDLQIDLFVSCILLVSVVLSGSRTALLALAIAVPVTYLSMSRVARSIYGQRIPVVVSVASPVVVGLFLVFSRGGSAFSMRGRIWQSATEFLKGDFDSLMFGLGSASWQRLQAAGTLPNHYPHSQNLALLFFGGGLSLALYVWFLLYIGTSRSRVLRCWAAPLPAVLLAIYGATEVIWDPVSFNYGVWILLLITLTGRSSNEVNDEPKLTRQDSILWRRRNSQSRSAFPMLS